MSNTIAKFEFDILNDFQKELHLTEDIDGSEKEDAVVELTSAFYREFRKTTWYSQFTARLKCNATENELVFTANNTFHCLLYTYMRQTFPALRIKKDFKGRVQVCWPHNLGTNHVLEGRVKFDDDVPQTIDSHWYDIYSQFYMKPGFRDHYNVCVGNVKFLEEWTDFLPEYTTNVIQPFYYMQDVSRAIPLYYFSSLSTVTQNYSVRNEIDRLLRMRIKTGQRENGETIWKEIPVNYKYIEGAGSTGILKTPELWGRYAYLTEDEVRWYKECSTGDDPSDKRGKVFYIEDVIACESVNPSSYGAKVPVDLDCKTPAKAMFWVAENLTSRENRNYSNYTTNPDSVYLGWNPIKRVSLSYGGSPRFDDMESDHFDKIECWKHFPSAPAEAGYNGYSFSLDSTSLDADVGIVMDGIKARLVSTLGNTDPYLKPVKENDEKKASIDELDIDVTTGSAGDKFSIHVRLLVMKKLIIRKVGDDKFDIKV